MLVTISLTTTTGMDWKRVATREIDMLIEEEASVHTDMVIKYIKSITTEDHWENEAIGELDKIREMRLAKL